MQETNNMVNKNSKIKKYIIPIIIAAVVLAIIEVVVIINNIPNKAKDLEFVTTASNLVTLDYDTYQNDLKQTKELNNLKKVKLWGYTGKAEYKADINQSYIVQLDWKHKKNNDYKQEIDVISENFDELYNKHELTEEGNYKWTITSNGDYKNLSSVLLTFESDYVEIIWETANEAYIIDDNIKNFGDISIESKADLDGLKNRYTFLNDDYKKYVYNYNMLEDYFKQYYSLFVKHFDETVEKCSKTVSADNYDKVKYLLDEYDTLDKEYKANVENYDLAKKVLSKCKAAKHKELVKELDEKCTSLGEYGNIGAEYLFNSYIDLLTVEDIENYLVYAVADKDMLSDAEECLKKNLKNPNSYVRYDYGITTKAVHTSEDLYYVKVNIRYGATNSFNAMVMGRQTVRMYYRVGNGKAAYITALCYQ